MTDLVRLLNEPSTAHLATLLPPDGAPHSARSGRPPQPRHHIGITPRVGISPRPARPALSVQSGLETPPPPKQIADKADIGTGTLFLYAKTKGELLLLVQNSTYADALVRGKAVAGTCQDF